MVVVDKEGEIHEIACGSRSFGLCPSCALRYRGDWSRIMREGLNVDSPQWLFFVTLTAPSFGKVHRRPGVKCPCGQVHSEADSDFQGLPIDFDTYDYHGQRVFNETVGDRWRKTNTYLRRELSPDLEYLVVREYQRRGAIHFHIMLRVPRRGRQRSVPPIIRRIAKGQGWGDQINIQHLTTLIPGKEVVGPDQKTITNTVNYCGKLLGYLAKDLMFEVKRKSENLTAAAKALARHVQNLGLQQQRSGHTVHQSRRTKNRPGWSGLTRKALHEARKEYAADKDLEMSVGRWVRLKVTDMWRDALDHHRADYYAEPRSVP